MIIIEQRYLRLKWLLFADVYEGVQVYGAHQCAADGFFQMKADSLRYTSALAVALAVVFLVITAGITAVILVNGSANMPRCFLILPISLYLECLHCGSHSYSSVILMLGHAIGSDNDRFSLIITALISLIFLVQTLYPTSGLLSQFTGATSAACLGFIFLAAIALRDPHFAAAKKDKVMYVLVIFLALFSSLVAIYSDACALFRRNPSPRA
ncbi:hypothetical protein NC651_024727 [Populus alba x Populus x berolinensis]|nr:hypothetical protein NC651_024727 [Populus alba x Populus x berolinensis]